MQMFEKEVYAWSKVKHENVLELLGYVFDETTGFPLLVSRWMPNGTAWDYVKKNRGITLSEVKALVSPHTLFRFFVCINPTLGA